MSSQWYYVENDFEVGPVDEATIRGKVRDGVVGPRDQVWRDDLPDWVEARTLTDLFPDSGPANAEPGPVATPPNGTGPLADRLQRSVADPSDVDGYEYASFWQRLVATFVDNFLLRIAGIVIGIVVAMTASRQFANSDAFGAVLIVVGLFINMLYFGFFEGSSKQATPGKMAMSLIVTDLNGNPAGAGRCMLRYVASLLSTVLLLIGYLIQPFTPRKQALHDLICGTLVYRRPKA